MFNIAKAIKKGNVRQASEGFEVWDDVVFNIHDRATQEDVDARRAPVVGACFNHRQETKRCSVICASLTPMAKKGDVVKLSDGKWKVWEVQESGDCHLWPLDKQVVTPHTNARWRHGNVYCLFGDGKVKVSIEGHSQPDWHK